LLPFPTRRSSDLWKLTISLVPVHSFGKLFLLYSHTLLPFALAFGTHAAQQPSVSRLDSPLLPLTYQQVGALIGGDLQARVALPFSPPLLIHGPGASPSPDGECPVTPPQPLGGLTHQAPTGHMHGPLAIAEHRDRCGWVPRAGASGLPHSRGQRRGKLTPPLGRGQRGDLLGHFLAIGQREHASTNGASTPVDDLLHGTHADEGLRAPSGGAGCTQPLVRPAPEWLGDGARGHRLDWEQLDGNHAGGGVLEAILLRLTNLGAQPGDPAVELPANPLGGVLFRQGLTAAPSALHHRGAGVVHGWVEVYPHGQPEAGFPAPEEFPVQPGGGLAGNESCGFGAPNGLLHLVQHLDGLGGALRGDLPTGFTARHAVPVHSFSAKPPGHVLPPQRREVPQAAHPQLLQGAHQLVGGAQHSFHRQEPGGQGGHEAGASPGRDVSPTARRPHGGHQVVGGAGQALHTQPGCGVQQELNSHGLPAVVIRQRPGGQCNETRAQRFHPGSHLHEVGHDVLMDRGLLHRVGVRMTKLWAGRESVTLLHPLAHPLRPRSRVTGLDAILRNRGGRPQHVPATSKPHSIDREIWEPQDGHAFSRSSASFGTGLPPASHSATSIRPRSTWLPALSRRPVSSAAMRCGGCPLPQTRPVTPTERMRPLPRPSPWTPDTRTSRFSRAPGQGAPQLSNAQLLLRSLASTGRAKVGVTRWTGT